MDTPCSDSRCPFQPVWTQARQVLEQRVDAQLPGLLGLENQVGMHATGCAGSFTCRRTFNLAGLEFHSGLGCIQPAVLGLGIAAGHATWLAWKFKVHLPYSEECCRDLLPGGAGVPGKASHKMPGVRDLSSYLLNYVRHASGHRFGLHTPPIRSATKLIAISQINCFSYLQSLPGHT